MADTAFNKLLPTLPSDAGWGGAIILGSVLPLAASALAVFAATLLLWGGGGTLATSPPMLNAPLSWYLGLCVSGTALAWTVFLLGYRAILSPRQGAVVFLGAGLLTTGGLLLGHTIGVVGVAMSWEHASHLAWIANIAVRMALAMTLLVYVTLPQVAYVSARHKVAAVACSAVLVFTTLVGALKLGSLRPVGSLPALETMAHCAVLAVLGVAAWVLGTRRSRLHGESVFAIAAGLLLTAISELVAWTPWASGQTQSTASLVFLVAALGLIVHVSLHESIQRPMRRLRERTRWERRMLDLAPDGVLWWNQDGVVTMANPAMQRLSGYAPTELVGKSIKQLISIQLPNLPSNGAAICLPVQITRHDGQPTHVEVSLGHCNEDGQHFVIAHLRDITERLQFERSLHFQSTHDELTGLPNRWLFRQSLGQLLQRAKKTQNNVAMLLLDLDDFKSVNDCLGHATGDELLVQVAKRLGTLADGQESIARLGGDEFGLMMLDENLPNDTQSLAQRILDLFQTPFRIAEQDVYAQTSIGLAFSPTDAGDVETLMRFADIALYHAKANGRGNYCRFDAAMDRRAKGQLEMHARLKDALQRGSLTLEYQPQVSLQTGAVVGVEALMRWFDPVLGQVGPDRFIPVAEATGLILPLSDWVLETACAQLATCSAQLMPINIAINISAHQFRKGDLPKKVESALHRHGVDAHLLTLEITESVAMQHPDQAITQLQALADLGCEVALDDFGTGFSSLSYLHTLPVSKVKIDKSFMKGVPGNETEVRFLGAIIALTKDLSLSIIAEGVEAQEQLAVLHRFGCTCYQGWYFSKAVTASTLMKELPRWTRAHASETVLPMERHASTPSTYTVG